ncbi:hypothetical protein K438DRAFT_1958839 [Mycena galopus ATCC 62051]|nr:hypothetical protein K438DRAFT_1958839 [Mycena galopus ATCC 62051]
MSSILHDFTLAWNSGLHFFLDSLYSPLPGVLYPPLEPDILGSQNGASYPSRLLSYGPPGLSLPRGTALSERSNQQDFWLRLWLWTSRTRSIHVVTPSLLSVLDHVLPYRGFYEPRRSHRLQRDLASYPLDWSVSELAHQHFLALASLSLWHVEIRGRMNWQIQVCWCHESPGFYFFRAMRLYCIQTCLRHGTLMTRPRDLLTVETRSWVSTNVDKRRR